LSHDKYTYPFIKSKKDELKKRRASKQAGSSFSYPFVSHHSSSKTELDIPIPSSTMEREVLSLLKTAIALTFDEILREMQVTTTELQRYLYNLGTLICKDSEDRYRLTNLGLEVETRISEERSAIQEF